ncbi:MAG: DUF427 domain-containing protein [Rhodospirillaceae bacterium]|nr:DUF427 domain-containing protein [Rhodospirillaceae bacterium]
MATPDPLREKAAQLARDGYRIDTAPCPTRAVARWHGRVIADSARAIVLAETRHNPVIYFPRADVRMDLLQRSTHRTHCPFKGDASYFTLADGAERAENAVWSYESPIPAVASIKDHVAFYTQDMGAAFGIVVER